LLFLKPETDKPSKHLKEQGQHIVVKVKLHMQAMKA